MSEATKKLERSAVYFPHNNIRNADFVKHALLFWDRVYTVVPPDTTIRDHSVVPERVKELEIILPRAPGSSEQYEVYRRLEQVASGPDAGNWLRATVPNSEMFPFHIEYPIYERKFSEETWRLLRELRLVDPGDRSDEPLTKPGAGLWLMAMLAEAMAGDSLATVTDRHEAYAWLEQAMARDKGMTEVNASTIADDSDEYEFAARATLSVLGIRDFDIEKLVKLREREAAGESWLRVARHNYLDLLSMYPDRVSEATRGGVQVEEFHEQFRAECEESLRALTEALQIVNLRALTNDKVTLPLTLVGAALAGAGTGSAMVAIGALGTGFTLGAARHVIETRQERRKALTTNRLAWGYLASAG